jgi:nucleoside-diphosphate-sugar epimerase
MRAFVTGATGYIGSAITAELMAAGHKVTGLARSDEAAAALTAAGAAVHRGSLEDLASLRAGAAASDGVIHNAFQNVGPDTDFAASVRADLVAVETMGEALAGSGRPFVVTSGTAGLPAGRLATEDDSTLPGFPRGATEQAALSLATRGVRVSVLRLAPSVHSDADRHGFIPSLIAIARAKGESAYIGDGSNRWSAVHRLDAARLFRLALEDAPPGAGLHAVGDEGVRLRDIASIIGRQLKVPVVSVRAEDAGDHFDWLAPFVQIDNWVSSALTQKELGWHPEQPGLIADLEAGHYFNDPE